MNLQVHVSSDEKMKLTSLSFCNNWLSFCSNFFCNVAICSRSWVIATTWSELLGWMTLLPVFAIFSGTSDKLDFDRSERWELFPRLFDELEFPILCDELVFNDASSADLFLCLDLSLSDFLAFAKARLKDNLQSQQWSFPSTRWSSRLKAHICWQISHFTAGPYLYSEAMHLKMNEIINKNVWKWASRSRTCDIFLI